MPPAAKVSLGPTSRPSSTYNLSCPIVNYLTYMPKFQKVFALLTFCLLLNPRASFALGQVQYVVTNPTKGSVALVQARQATPIYVDSNDYAGVVRATGDLQADIARVTGITPKVTNTQSGLGRTAVFVGTLGKSPVLDRIIREKKIDVAPLKGKWESFLIQVVPNPLPGVQNGLVIVGSDKRGTIYGIYDVSQEIGVSPWYWWADVPAKHQDALYIKSSRYMEGEPAVKYRGIFINDEEPALGNWSREKFGGINSKMYSHMFELLLRLKANYLWPAMWGKAFNEDDPLNPKLADEYGIVMGTSHHEPMIRAQSEWSRRRKGFGNGEWDYLTNRDGLQKFWAEGVERNKGYESILTVGMRGDGDKPMMEDADAATKLMETIIADQRKIIADYVNPDPAKVPQLWALYKEVQEYYEKGMRVPDDVTLLWADDNYGNLRRLPTPEERKRSGGAGIYYHVDYVGAPRSYKWLNTVPISKIWEQMNLAHEYGANRIWIVNVGDLKPMEFPIEFFLDFAREPKQWPHTKLNEYTRLWAQREFGPTYATEIADIIEKYTKYNGRRKPELLEPETFSLVNYGEADRVQSEWKSITDKAEQINAKLPPEARDAFFQLVLYPTKASAIVNELYITAGKNRLYASQGRVGANDMAAQVKALFQADADLTTTYNKTIAGGKWSHMMDQTHIGYTSWGDPRTNIMPGVKELEVPAEAAMGVAVEGSTAAWPVPAGNAEALLLPAFDALNQQRHWVDVFNRGQGKFNFSVTPGASWIQVSALQGTIEKEERLWISIDWTKVPPGHQESFVKIARLSAGQTVQEATFEVQAFHPAPLPKLASNIFVEDNGYVSIEAEHFTKRVDAGPVGWRKFDNRGRTLSAMFVSPVTASSVTPPQNSPCLEYGMYVFTTGQAEVQTLLSPTLNFVPGRAIRFAVSFDGETPQVIELPKQSSVREWANKGWSDAVKDNVFTLKSRHSIMTPGYHTLKVWMVDPGVTLQKIVVNLGGVRPSYLGPPESGRTGKTNP